MNRILLFAFAIIISSCSFWSKDEPNRYRTVASLTKDKEVKENLRIAVIGAGASGLTAAYYLQKYGYKNVFVFEKYDRAGGKVYSQYYDQAKDKFYDVTDPAATGNKYEFGAVWVAGLYENTKKFAKEFDISLTQAPNMQQMSIYNPVKITDKFDPETGRSENETTSTEWLLDVYGKKVTNPRAHGTTEPWGSKMDLAKAYVKFNAVATKYNRETRQPGYTSKHKALHVPHSEFIKSQKISPIAEVMEPLITGCGYGYYDEVPALYMMKFTTMLVDTMHQSGMRDIFQMKEISQRYVDAGYQMIWEKVAEKINGPDQDHVFFNSEVVKVVRNGISAENPIEVYIKGEETPFYFDRIIISSDLKHAVSERGFLKDSATGAEKELFNMIEHYPYYIQMFSADNLVVGSDDASGNCIGGKPECRRGYDAMFLKENEKSDRIGHTIILSNPFHDTTVYQTWAMSKRMDTDADMNKFMEEKLKEDVASWGGTNFKMIRQEKWEYFPHVKTAGLNANFYDRVEKMQGQNGTYYIGGIMNFESVEFTADYAKNLVETKFKKGKKQ